MSPRSLVRPCLAGAAAILLTAAYQRAHTIPLLTETAKELLRTLNSDQKAKIMFPIDSEERFHWDYRPVPRKGLAIREMDPYQKHLANALLAAGLSQRGYIKAETIMSIEDVLRMIEKDSGERRNPEKYYFTLFGEPSETGTWALRVEGHHLSLNYTIVNGKIVAAPTFFGSNPDEVRVGPRKGLRVLKTEDDLGRELIESLSPAQKEVAIVTKDAYKDILTDNRKRAEMLNQPQGLLVSKMTGKQKAILDRVISEYANNLPDDMAAARLDQAKRDMGQMYFAWAGVEQPGGPHYYRVQTPNFIIEYDNTQDNANHVHTVWREFNGDWGLDLMKQ
ncbi:MAG TPA: DUF3500 domain-containing protein [Bryobacteraceae bacterium]|jgi:hypothetical protein